MRPLGKIAVRPIEESRKWGGVKVRQERGERPLCEVKAQRRGNEGGGERDVHLNDHRKRARGNKHQAKKKQNVMTPQKKKKKKKKGNHGGTVCERECLQNRLQNGEQNAHKGPRKER